MVFERYAFNRVHRTRTGEHGSSLQFFTFNFQLARGQSHCRDCPLAFGDILILKGSMSIVGVALKQNN